MSTVRTKLLPASTSTVVDRLPMLAYTRITSSSNRNQNEPPLPSLPHTITSAALLRDQQATAYYEAQNPGRPRKYTSHNKLSLQKHELQSPEPQDLGDAFHEPNMHYESTSLEAHSCQRLWAAMSCTRHYTLQAGVSKAYESRSDDSLAFRRPISPEALTILHFAATACVRLRQCAL